MISLMKDWKGKVVVNDTEYDSIQDAMSAFKTLSGDIHIILKSAKKRPEKQTIEQSEDATEYEVTVKQYMTKKATPDFDFMAKWNNNNPMPMRIMRGTVEKETRGMIYMNLHGFAQETITCACCGKELTNPVSRYYGIGPICLDKLGIARDIDDVKNIKEDLVNITWSGWVIRSSIVDKKEVIRRQNQLKSISDRKEI